jgi:hypothetical protein
MSQVRSYSERSLADMMQCERLELRSRDDGAGY